MKIRIDYHFHPNLSGNDKRAKKKCLALWQRFQKKGINAVITTEHIYKNPRRAYELMKKYKPEELFCFPGMEYVTKEGIDIVIFSDSENIYNYTELKTFKLPYFDLIKFVNSKDNLYAYVTHPYTLGLTSVVNKLGKEAYSRSTDLLDAVEISNGAFDNLFFLLNSFPFSLFSKTKIKKISDTRKLPKEDYPSRINFLAAGSDAHHAGDIGNCYEIDYSGDASREKVFRAIITNKGKGRVIYDNKKFDFPLLVRAGLTSLSEFLTKMFLRLSK